MTPEELKESARQEAIARIKARATAAMDKEEAPLRMANPLVALAAMEMAVMTTPQPSREPVRPRMFDLSDAERKHKQKAKLKRRQEKASRRRNRG